MLGNIEFLEELGDVEGMEFFVCYLKHADELLFYIFEFDGAEECGKVALKRKLFEDEESFEVVEEDSGSVGQSDGQASLHIKYYEI